jgi:outer membrane protein OmpA-like peptidoglycan-associated protein
MILLLSKALAAGYSMDIELVRPFFSPDAMPGLADPEVEGFGGWRVGTWMQIEKSPLILYRDSRDVGSVIETRYIVDLGFEVDLNDWLALHSTFPVSLQANGEDDRLSADGFGVGDLVVGGRAHIYDFGPLHTGFRLDLVTPTSTKESWRGEALPRLSTGILLSVPLKRFVFLGEVGGIFRQPVVTGEDFTLGQELTLSLGGRYNIFKEAFSIWGLGVARAGFSNFLAAGAESVAEGMIGIRFKPVPMLRCDIWIGSGLTEGYGTTDLRLGTGLTIVHPVKKEPPPQPLTVDIGIDPPDIIELPKEPEPEPVVVQWKEKELARLEENQIIIRDPIQFEFGTDVILPISQPTLDQVAQILQQHPELLHIVIEGHASEEGSYLYNYELSLKRANAIWRALVLRGVHPSRLSTRAMGEVQPVNLGTDEASLAENRRVVFHIIKRWFPGDPIPEYIRDIKLPWTGDTMTVPELPPLPEPKPVEPPPPEGNNNGENIDPNLFRQDEEEEEK